MAAQMPSASSASVITPCPIRYRPPIPRALPTTTTCARSSSTPDDAVPLVGANALTGLVEGKSLLVAGRDDPLELSPIQAEAVGGQSGEQIANRDPAMLVQLEPDTVRPGRSTRESRRLALTMRSRSAMASMMAQASMRTQPASAGRGAGVQIRHVQRAHPSGSFPPIPSSQARTDSLCSPRIGGAR